MMKSKLRSKGEPNFKFDQVVLKATISKTLATLTIFKDMLKLVKTLQVMLS